MTKITSMQDAKLSKEFADAMARMGLIKMGTKAILAQQLRSTK